MKLLNLIECKESLAQTEIGGITCDSRQVKQGFAFVCIKGAKSDGHDFAEKARCQYGGPATKYRNDVTV